MKSLASFAVIVALAGLFSACSSGGRNTQFSPPSDAERACVEAFKKQAGQNRVETWKMLQPLLTNRLASVPRTKTALKDFFEQWLGRSEDVALKRSEGAVVWPMAPESRRNDVFAYQLKNEDYFSEDLVVDFRNPEKVQMGVASCYAPPPKKSPHDQISQDERRIAGELRAMEINLGGGSEDGSAKPGFWVYLDGAQASEANVRKAAKLTTLVSLRLSGSSVTDACMSPLKDHAYLASLELKSTSISDAGLAHLTGLGALKWLKIDGGNVTEQGIQSLRAVLLKCEIESRTR
ncbi:MAG: hypothetical protein WCH99_19465 [Verrucomicrobiota bacterium]